MKYKSVLKKPNYAPIIIEIEVTENNICYIDVEHGTELNNKELSFNNVALQFMKLQDNIYAMCLNQKGIYEIDGELFSLYDFYDIQKNITINDEVIYGDILIIGIYDENIFSLSIEETDKYIALLK